MEKLEHATVAPLENTMLDIFKSEPAVPTVPVPTTVDPSLSTKAKYPAVPLTAFVSLAIELAVAVTTPPLALAAPKAVAPNVRDARRVPVSEALRAGCDPL
jgi:hypothetical protein